MKRRSRSLIRWVVAFLLVASVGVGTLALQTRNAPSAFASCAQTQWIETGISSSVSGNTTVTAYLQELVERADHSSYCGSLRTRVHWQFNAPNYCDSFAAAIDGQYGIGQYGVVYSSYMCSGNIMGQPQGDLYSGSKAETCGTVDGWDTAENHHTGHSGGCF